MTGEEAIGADTASGMGTPPFAYGLHVPGLKELQKRVDKRIDPCYTEQVLRGMV